MRSSALDRSGLLLGTELGDVPGLAHWELGRSRPQGSNRAALVALRGVGRREVKRMLGGKK
jgi:hypothetical protein